MNFTGDEGNPPGQDWWNGPPPAGYTGPWPPPLPPGAQYGTDPGSIVYPPNSPGPTNPNPADSYNPGNFGNPPPTTSTQPPPTTGGTSQPPPTTTRSNNPGISPTPAAPTPPPTFNPPSYTPPPAEQRPPPFTYDPFTAPTATDLFSDPGYRARLQQGTDSLQRSAAAAGVLNTGGTLKDILGYGQDLASQEYQNLWGRDYSAYQTNRANAYDNYSLNFGIDRAVNQDNYTTQYKDPFAISYQGATDTFGANQHNYDQNLYYTNNNNQFNQTLDFNRWVQQYYQNRTNQNDDFYRQYTLLNYL